MAAPSRLELLEQVELIDRIKACRHGVPVTREEIAQAAGCEPCLVSKWTTDGADPRRISLEERYRLADHFGWDVVFGPRAARAGWGFVPVSAGGERSVEEVVADLAAATVDAQHPRSPGGHLVVAPERPGLGALCREYLRAERVAR